MSFTETLFAAGPAAAGALAAGILVALVALAAALRRSLGMRSVALVRERAKLERDAWRMAWGIVILRKKRTSAAMRVDVQVIVAQLRSVIGEAQVDPSCFDAVCAMPTSVLLKELASGSVSAVNTAAAFVTRAHQIDDQFHVLADSIPMELAALERGRYLDEYLKLRGKTFGPLHGLPISVKDNLHVARTATTFGLVKRTRWAGAQAEKSTAAIVELALSAGAVPYVKTNVPQCLLSFETVNFVFGTTKNPHDPERTAGGSSGGEAALIAAGGAPVGIGTDIGGSARIPAFFCGICGLKPTRKRIPQRGADSVTRGQVAISPTSGYLGRSVSDVALFFRAIVDENAGDCGSAIGSEAVPLPFQQHLFSSGDPLTIAVAETDGFLAPSRRVRAGVRCAAEALRAAGHETVALDLSKLAPRWMRIFSGLLTADGAEAVKRAVEGEPQTAAVRSLLQLVRMPRAVRRALAVLCRALGHDVFAFVGSAAGEKSVYHVWKLQSELEALRSEILQLLAGMGAHALLLPPLAITAPRHGETARIPGACAAQMLANVIDVPAGIVPISVSAQEIADTPHTEPVENNLWQRICTRLHRDEGANAFSGAQVFAPPFREEIVLRLMGDIEKFRSARK